MQRLMLRFIFFGFLGTQLHIALSTALAAEPKSEMATLDARPEPIAIDAARSAVIVVDMENDFAAKGGMFDRAGVDISGAQKAITPTAKVLAAARQSGLKIIYLKMGYHPDLSDVVIYKTRFSGFYQTDLDATLKKFGIKYLIFTGVTTSICVESTVRDAMFRDYLCVLLRDCMSEPMGHDLPRTNHEASLLNAEALFGWVSDSDQFIKAVAVNASQARR